MFSLPLRATRHGSALLLSCVLFAPVARPASLSWDELPGRIRDLSPELVSARRELEEIRARVDAAGWKPSPSIGMEFKPGLASGGQGSVQAGYEKTLHRAERLRSEKDAVTAHVPVLEARLRQREADLLAEARTAAVTLLMVPLRLELVERRQAAAVELGQFLASRAAAGEISPLEAGQARLESAQAGVQRAQIDAARTGAEHRLRQLLGWPPDEPLALAGELAAPAPEPAEPAASAPSSAGEIARAEAALAEVEAEVSRQEAQPEKSIGVFAEFERAEDDPDGVGNEVFAGIALTIPLAIPGKADAAAREATLRSHRLRAEGTRLDETAAREAQAARASMHAQAQVFRTAGAEPARLAGELEQHAQTMLRAGLGDLTAVLRARTQRLATEEVRLDALEAYHLARVRLDAALRR